MEIREGEGEGEGGELRRVGGGGGIDGGPPASAGGEDEGARKEATKGEGSGGNRLRAQSSVSQAAIFEGRGSKEERLGLRWRKRKKKK